MNHPTTLMFKLIGIAGNPESQRDQLSIGKQDQRLHLAAECMFRNEPVSLMKAGRRT